jgi:Family of unknown function (DUF6535)
VSEKKKMWTGYLKEDEQYDSGATEAWKGDSVYLCSYVPMNVLFRLFITLTSRKTGLFSATVGAFVIEFYKKLSPDSGDQTIALLCQISQQFRERYLLPTPGLTPDRPDQSFSPGASIIWANALCIISLP